MKNLNIGVSYPFRFTGGRLASAGGVPDVLPTKAELDGATLGGVRQVILTGPKERAMLGRFGVGADEFLFHPLGQELIGFLDERVREQIELWCERVSVRAVRSDLSQADARVEIAVHMDYRDLPDDVMVRVTEGGDSG